MERLGSRCIGESLSFDRVGKHIFEGRAKASNQGEEVGATAMVTKNVE